MDNARNRRLIALFDDICDQPPAAQRAALDAIDDPELRAALSEMLRADAARTARPAPPREPEERSWWAPVVLVVSVVVAVAAGVVLHAWLDQDSGEAGARRHLDAAERELRRLHDAGRLAEADAVFEAFARLPEHADTRALSQGWTRHARRLRGEGRPEARRAAAEAWVQAVHPDDRRAAAAELATALLAEGRWAALSRLGDATPEPGPEVADEVFTAAIAMRDIRALDRLPASREADRAMVAALTTARPVAEGARGATVVDGQVLVTDDDGLRIIGRPERIPHPDGTPYTDRITAFAGSLVLPVQDGDATRLVRLEDGAWRPWQALPSGVPQRLTADGDTLLVALSYPARGLFEVREGAAPTRAAAVPTALDSDVMDVRVVDLDGDGVTERVVAAGAWTAYDVRLVQDGRTLARRRLGLVDGIAALPGGRILAAKRNGAPSQTWFGGATPFGPESGLYVLGPDLAIARVLPNPWGDGGEDLVDDPKVGDLDGDGRPDAVVAIGGPGRPLGLWVIGDVGGRASSLVLVGLRAGGLSDVDGDGDDELLVTDEDGAVWFLGTGDARLPIWRDPTVADDGHPEGAFAEHADHPTWQGAAALVHLGLIDDAAASLARLGALQDAPAEAAAALLEAGRLEFGLGDHRSAAQRFAHVAEVAGEGTDTWRAAVAGLARARARDLDLDGARTAWRWLADAGDPAAARELAWLEPVTQRPFLTLLDAARPPAAEWTVRSPAALRASTRRDTRLDVFNDEGPIATTAVELAGERLGIELALTITQAELGAGVSVAIADAAGTDALRAMVYTVGGAGRAVLQVGCGHGSTSPPVTSIPVDDLPVSLVLRAERLDALGDLTCRVRVGDDVFLSRLADPTPVPTGPHRLVLGAAGHPTYNPPTRFTAAVGHLRVDGVHALSAPSASPSDPARAVWDALALGDARALAAAPLADAELRWMLRRHPELATSALAARPEFPRLFREAWDEAWRFVRHDDVRTALRQPALSTLPGDDPDTAAIRLAQARLAWQDGDDARALRLARLATTAAPDDGQRTLAEAHLLVARLLVAGGEPDAAAAAVAAHIAAAPSPDLGRDRVRTYAELAPLLGQHPPG